MTRHLSYRSGNPALNKNTFKGLSASKSSGPLIRNDYMTIDGTVNKTAISLFLLIFAGYYSYTSNLNYLWLIGAGAGIITFFIVSDLVAPTPREPFFKFSRILTIDLIS